VARDWIDLLAEAIGAPDNAIVRTAFVGWADSEGMPDSEHNWLATTQPGFGGHSVNSVGVQSYPTVADGVAALNHVLRNGLYDNVLREFRTGTSMAGMWSAINQSPWCGGCQEGKYPVVLYDALASGTQPPPGGGTPGQAGHTPLPAAPAPTAKNDWSERIHRTAGQFTNVSLPLHRYAAVIERSLRKR